MSDTPTTDPQVPDEGEFTRVHPVSPFIRGGLVVLAVLGYLVSQQIDSIVSALSDVPEVPGEGGDGGGGGDFPLLQLAVVSVTVLGAVLLGLLSWWFTRYRLGETTLEMHSGAIFRQHRQVRYDRIQTVDLVRPLLARLCGLSEVRVESAGGGDSHVSIAYLARAEADRVRQRILGLAEAAGAPAATGGAPGAPDVPDDGQSGAEGPAGSEEVAGDRSVPEGEPRAVVPRMPVRHVLSVPPQRVVASVLLSWDAIFLVVFLVVALVLAFFGVFPVIAGFMPFIALNVLRAFGRLSRWYGLTIGLRGETLTSQRGLTDTRTSSVPLHRVQALQIDQSVLWRRPGWWSLKVNVAGANIGSAAGDDSESVLVPVATTREVLDLLEVVTADPQTTAEVTALVEGTPEGFVGLPRRARWVHPFARRRIGYLPGRRALHIRSGRLDHRVQVVPWGRIQSLTLRQGVVARRLDLATVQPVSTVGPVDPSVDHLDRLAAERLARLAAARASRARRRPSGLVGCDPAPDTVDCAR